MSVRSRTLPITVAVLAAGLVAAAPGLAPASASPEPSARKLDGSVGAPFEIAVQRGTVWWSDGGAGTVTRRLSNGHKKVVARVHGEIAGVAVRGKQLAFTASPNGHFSRLVVRRPGHTSMVVNLRAYERLHNPDANKTYGIVSGGNQCARDFFQQATGAPPRYKGQIDSHPYQVKALPNGAWAVAEAAGNAVLRVSRTGHISTIAVLPRQTVKITQQMADALGAPDCVVGVRYGFEPVPTDVERDRHGNLYVSLLPGGPEDPSLGARGAVYKIAPGTAPRRIAQGFAGATNLAVAPSGKLYVAELFAGRISTIRGGRIVGVRTLKNAVSVEATKRNLFVGQLGGNGPGGVFRFPR